MAVPFVSCSLTLAQGLSLAGGEAAALHLISGAVEVLGLPVDPLGL
jgi:hypothetical protein